MTSKEDEELIAKLIEGDLSIDTYQENTFINYNNNNNNNNIDEMQRQMNQVLETANLLRWEYENNLMNERLEAEEKKKLEQLELEERRRIIEQQDREYAEIIKEEQIKEEEMKKENTVPIRFICPISNKIMENPIYDSISNTHYEKSVLLSYLNKNNNQNHMGIFIDKSKLVIDNNLKQEIFYWKREHPENN
jgi:type III secretory pathway component EscV